MQPLKAPLCIGIVGLCSAIAFASDSSQALRQRALQEHALQVLRQKMAQLKGPGSLTPAPKGLPTRAELLTGLERLKKQGKITPQQFDQLTHNVQMHYAAGGSAMKEVQEVPQAAAPLLVDASGLMAAAPAETPEQQKAIEVLRQKIAQMQGQGAPAPSRLPAASAPTNAPALSPSDMQAIAQKVLNKKMQELATQTQPSAASAATTADQQKALEVLRQKMSQLQAQQPLPSAQVPSPSTQGTVPMVIKVPRPTAAPMTSVPPAQPMASPATAPAPAPVATTPAAAAPSPAPSSATPNAQPAPQATGQALKKSKQELLKELLQRYEANQITPLQYQEQRAKILGHHE